MSEKFYIESEHGRRIDGPYSTLDDALRARFWVEIAMKPETFFVRSHGATRSNYSPEHPIHGWLQDLYEHGFVVVDTKDTHYAYAGSAVGSLRRHAKRVYGMKLRAEDLGAHKAAVEVVK